MVFLAVLIEAGLVLYSSLIVFRGQMSSGSAGYLPFVRLTDRTSASPTARSYALSTAPVLPEKKFAFMLVPKSLWTLPLPVVWNRGRLDISRKQVQCHRCFLFARRCLPSESTKHVDALRESAMFAPPSTLGQMMRSLTIGSWQKARGRGCNAGEVCARRLLFFQVALWKSTGFVHAVCMRGDDWEIL